MSNDHQPAVAVLADDLTSAADGAAPFVARGMTAAVGGGQLPRQLASVLAIVIGRALLIAMKAGGFGCDDALECAVARIRGAAQPSEKNL